MAKKKFTPKKKKTLVPEPNWEKLRKLKSEEDRYKAWLECDEYIRHEIPEREINHCMRRWVELYSGWDLVDQVKRLPDTYLIAYARHGYKYRVLDYMPAKVLEILESDFKPLVKRAYELRDKLVDHVYDFSHLEDDHPWHPVKVKEWAKKWSAYAKSLDPDSKVDKIRMEYQIAQVYVSNLNAYLRTGIWLDSHWGENREYKCVSVCKVMAYHPDGTVKRTVGTWYSDVQGIWTKEMELECNLVN